MVKRRRNINIPVQESRDDRKKNAYVGGRRHTEVAVEVIYIIVTRYNIINVYVFNIMFVVIRDRCT